MNDVRGKIHNLTLNGSRVTSAIRRYGAFSRHILLEPPLLNSMEPT